MAWYSVFKLFIGHTEFSHMLNHHRPLTLAPVLLAFQSIAYCANPIVTSVFQQTYDGDVFEITHEATKVGLHIRSHLEQRGGFDFTSRHRVPVELLPDDLKPPTEGPRQNQWKDFLSFTVTKGQVAAVAKANVAGDVIRKGAFLDVRAIPAVNGSLDVIDATVIESTIGNITIQDPNLSRVHKLFAEGYVETVHAVPARAGEKAYRVRGVIAKANPLTIVSSGKMLQLNLPDQLRPKIEIYGASLDQIKKGDHARLKVAYLTLFWGNPADLAQANGNAQREFQRLVAQQGSRIGQAVTKGFGAPHSEDVFAVPAGTKGGHWEQFNDGSRHFILRRSELPQPKETAAETRVSNKTTSVSIVTEMVVHTERTIEASTLGEWLGKR